MMSDIHAPAELLANVKGIPMEKATKKKLSGFALKYATAACAALLGVFIVTNGVCYAATGETWVEKATVWVNGQPREMDVQMTQDGETTVGTIEYELADGSDAIELSMSVDGADPNDTEFTINDYTVREQSEENALPCQVLESKDGKVVLAVDGVEPIDITDQLRETGGAIDEFKKDGATYIYKVSGESGNYHASIEVRD